MSTSDGHTSTPLIHNGSAFIDASADIQSRTTPSTGFAQPRGLQLGGSKTNTKATAAQLAEQVAAEECGNDAWADNNDLMDVNADEGDWSKSLHLSEHIVFHFCVLFQVRLRVRLPRSLPQRPTLDLELRAQVPRGVR
jgi:hypothetical protein